jgi:hypothetical protein
MTRCRFVAFTNRGLFIEFANEKLPYTASLIHHSGLE